MNILYLTGCLDVGGTEVYTLNMAKAMKDRGHKVYWATVQNGRFKKTVEEQGIELLHCNLGSRIPSAFFQSLLSIRRISKEKEIEIVHSADAYSAMVASLAFRNSKKKPYLIWSNVGIGSKTYSLMLKICGKSFDMIIAVSNFIRNRMIEEGFDPEKIKCHIGSREMKLPTIDRQVLRREIGIEKEDIVIGTVGRVVKMKGNKTIILAMPEILKAVPNAKLLIVGDGLERQELEKLVCQMNLENRIVFLGFRQDIENMYNIFDIVAFPTYYEALGYIPVEAMFYEKPLIASLTGGIPEIVIDSYNGLVVPPAIPQMWSKAIIKLLTGLDLQERLRQNGKQYYNSHLTEKISNDGLEQLYFEVMNSGNSAFNINYE